MQGALANLRHEISRGSISKVLKAAGLAPARMRRQGMTWKEFIKTHWDVLAATDFFTVELWTAKGWIRYPVFFVIKLATREVKIAGLVPEPGESGMLAQPLVAPFVLAGLQTLFHLYFQNRLHRRLHCRL